MAEYVGFDVSKEETAFCVMDEEGVILARGKVSTDPAALFEVLREHCPCAERIVLETGTLSFWLARELCKRGMPVDVIDARLAGTPPQLDLPLHAHLVLVAQRRRGILRKAHPAKAQAWCVPLRREPPGRHQPLRRRTQPKPHPLQMESRPQRNHRRRQKGAPNVGVNPLVRLKI